MITIQEALPISFEAEESKEAERARVRSELFKIVAAEIDIKCEGCSFKERAIQKLGAGASEISLCPWFLPTNQDGQENRHYARSRTIAQEKCLDDNRPPFLRVRQVLSRDFYDNSLEQPQTDKEWSDRIMPYSVHPSER